MSLNSPPPGAQEVSSHYNNRKDVKRTLTSGGGEILCLRNFNNWVKSVLINKYAKSGDAVLDIACGKGGDYLKWSKASISYYVGVDIAHESVEDALRRYNESNFAFEAHLFSCDCFATLLAPHLRKISAPLFDVVSCQFAIHYSFATEETVRVMFRNVTERLRVGGYFIGTCIDADVLKQRLSLCDDKGPFSFGNNIYRFDVDTNIHTKPFGNRYVFWLDSAIDNCPEFIVPPKTFEIMAEEYGLQMIHEGNNAPRFNDNFHDFYHCNCEISTDKEKYRELLKRICGGKGGSNWMTQLEWEAVYSYRVFVFTKIMERGSASNEQEVNYCSEDAKLPRKKYYRSKVSEVIPLTNDR